MKKLLLILMAVVCAVSMCACTNDETGSAVESENESVATSNTVATGKVNPDEVYTLTVNGESLYVHAEMASLTEKLGEPTSYFESESCAFQGLDKVYTYGGVVVRTYPENGDDYILSLEIKDDSVSTPEGISIGDTKETVISVYGEPTESGSDSFTYKKGESVLSFIFNGEEVNAITYL